MDFYIHRRPAPLPLRHALPRPREVDVEVHAVDARRRVVLDAEVDVLGDAEAEAAGLREVLLPQLVLVDLEAALEELVRLLATHRRVDRHLLVTAHAPGPDRLAAPRVHRLLVGELLEHARRTRQAITRLANGAVQHQLLDAQLAHGVLIRLGHGWKRARSGLSQ